MFTIITEVCSERNMVNFPHVGIKSTCKCLRKQLRDWKHVVSGCHNRWQVEGHGCQLFSATLLLGEKVLTQHECLNGPASSFPWQSGCVLKGYRLVCYGMWLPLSHTLTNVWLHSIALCSFITVLQRKKGVQETLGCQRAVTAELILFVIFLPD